MAKSDEAYLDNLLNSVMASDSARTVKRPTKNKSHKVEEASSASIDAIPIKPLPVDPFELFFNENEIDDIDSSYNIFDDKDISLFNDSILEEDIMHENDYDELQAEAYDYINEENINGKHITEENINGKHIAEENINSERINNERINIDNIYNNENINSENVNIENNNNEILNNNIINNRNTNNGSLNKREGSKISSTEISNSNEIDSPILPDNNTMNNIYPLSNDAAELKGINEPFHKLNSLDSMVNENDKAEENNKLRNDSDVDELLQGLFENMNETDMTEQDISNISTDSDDIMELLNSLTSEADTVSINNSNILSIDDFSDNRYEEAAASEKTYDINELVDFGLDELLAEIEDRTPKEDNTIVNKDKKKPNIFKRLFGNVPDGISDDERNKIKEKIVNDYEAKEKAELEKVNKKALSAKDKEAQKKAAIEAAKVKKAEAAKAKIEKEKEKKAKLAAKKDEKLRRQQEIKELVDAVDEDNGKINKVGSAIVFIIFTIFAVFVIVGTNVYTYQKSMEDSKNYYNRQFYNEAFELIYGMTIKEEDTEFYNQLLTIMYVQKQLNSYENFFKLEYYANALDSLLKGLILYDKYYIEATIFNIENDLDYVKQRILTELWDAFEIDNTTAISIIKNYNSDRLTYSNAVFDYASIYNKEDLGNE